MLHVVAVILAVEEIPVMTPVEAHAAPGRYSTWDDGTPMYDENGAVNPDDEMRRFNLMTADTRRLWELWTPFSMTWENVIRAYL